MIAFLGYNVLMTEFSSFRYSGKEELEKLESHLENYNNHIVSTFLKHAGPHVKSILDFGAGIGTLSNIWRRLRTDSKISCLEIDRTQQSILINRGFSILEYLPNKNVFDYIFTSNVLEHIEDDQKTLDKLFTTLNSGGVSESLYQQIDLFIQLLILNLGIFEDTLRRN